MDAREIKTVEDARAVVEARGLAQVKVGVTDIDGVIRGKYMAREKFFSALTSGFNFCDVVFGWDSHDQLYDRATVTGWEPASRMRPCRSIRRRRATRRSKATCCCSSGISPAR